MGIHVPLRAAAEWTAPETIRVKHDELRPIPSGKVSVQVELVDGARAPIESLLLRPHEWTRNIGTQDIAVGETLIVPCGQYSFLPSQISVFFPETACSSMRLDMKESSEPVAAIIRMLTPVQRVNIDIQPPIEDTPLAGFVTLRSGKHELKLSAQRTIKLLLPVGEWLVEWNMSGFKSGAATFSCFGLATSEPQLVTIPMEPN